MKKELPIIEISIKIKKKYSMPLLLLLVLQIVILIYYKGTINSKSGGIEKILSQLNNEPFATDSSQYKLRHLSTLSSYHFSPSWILGDEFIK